MPDLRPLLCVVPALALVGFMLEQWWLVRHGRHRSDERKGRQDRKR